MTNYLAAIDLADEESQENILKTVVEMAAGVENVRIFLMTVIPGVPAGLDVRYAIRGEMQGSADYPLQKWKDEAAKRLGEIAANHVPKEMRAGVVVRNGTIYREIVEAAKDLDIKQIVMGAHRPSLADFLLGPNSDRVARHAGCTVTVVRN